jgi:hypothetical protein
MRTEGKMMATETETEIVRVVSDETPVDVIFRVWKTDATDVFALFPGLAGTMQLHTCTCYQHVGQHSSADLAGCMRASRAATEAEYAPLKRELERRGYVLNVVLRTTARHLRERAKQLHD